MLSETTEPGFWIMVVLIAAAVVYALLRPYPRPPKGPPMVDDTKKDPLASLRPSAGSMQTNVETPEAVRAALMEIVAEAIRTNSLHRHWDLTGLQSGGFPLGSYRITIEKTA